MSVDYVDEITTSEAIFRFKIVSVWLNYLIGCYA
jgi:hypothetical protein